MNMVEKTQQESAQVPVCISVDSNKYWEKESTCRLIKKKIKEKHMHQCNFQFSRLVSQKKTKKTQKNKNLGFLLAVQGASRNVEASVVTTHSNRVLKLLIIIVAQSDSAAWITW